jgi:hypothetical protein
MPSEIKYVFFVIEEHLYHNGIIGIVKYQAPKPFRRLNIIFYVKLIL